MKIWQLITLVVICFFIGAGGRHYFAVKYQKQAMEKIENGQRILDSVQIVNQQQKIYFEQKLIQYSEMIKKHRKNLNLRNEKFKTDTIIPSDDELISRARILTTGTN